MHLAMTEENLRIPFVKEVSIDGKAAATHCRGDHWSSGKWGAKLHRQGRLFLFSAKTAPIASPLVRGRRIAAPTVNDEAVKKRCHSEQAKRVEESAPRRREDGSFDLLRSLKTTEKA